MVSEAPLANWDKAPVCVEKISSLVWDLNLYPRCMVDRETVEKYARALKAGSVFPPVKVGLLNGEKIIVDGVHRIRARKLLGIEYIECAELPFKSMAELFAEAVRLNSSHGKTLSKKDLKWSIKQLQKFKFSVKEIVALAHVPASEIHRITPSIKSLTTPSGKKWNCKPECSSRQPNIREILEFKNALIFIRDAARKGCIPKDDPLFKQLVTECRLALGGIRFDVQGTAMFRKATFCKE
jgi:hypothetical protein